MPRKKETGILTETDIRSLVQEEMNEALGKINTEISRQGKDITEIKNALLGTEYNKNGIASLVRKHDEYISRNENSDIANRGLKVVEWYERFNKKEGTNKQSNMEILEDGISGLKAIATIKKWSVALGVTNIGTLVALILTNLEKFIK